MSLFSSWFQSNQSPSGDVKRRNPLESVTAEIKSSSLAMDGYWMVIRVGKGSYSFHSAGHPVKYPSTYGANTPPVEQQTWLLGLFMAQVKDQLAGDFPEIFYDRARDLLTREQPLWEALAEYATVPALERSAVEKQLLKRVEESRRLWAEFSADLTMANLATGNSKLSQILVSLTPQKSDAAYQLELDQAYDEYKKIFNSHMRELT